MTRFILLLTSLIMLIPAGSSVAAEAGTTFSCSVTKDAETAWNIVELSAENKAFPLKNISVKITPEGGNNLYSFTVGGTELLYGPQSLSQLSKQFLGIPILYPTPNRIRNGIYVFLGDTLKMSFPGEARSHAGHGLVWDDTAWKFDPPVAGKNWASFTARYIFDEKNPRLAAYPFPNMLTVEYTLFADRVLVRYEVINQGTKPMGFGFALHPFWNILGQRDQVTIQVPLPYHMDATNMLPSGKLDEVKKGSKWSLLEPTLLSNLNLDDVYFGSNPKREAVTMFRAAGLEIRQKASADFTHVVVYTPEKAKFFCIENQTCSTDALNLYSQGLVKESHLQVLKPGQKTGGQVEYIPVWKSYKMPPRLSPLFPEKKQFKEFK